MREFARRQVAALLRRLDGQLKRTAATADADAVHDLRVAVRRLSRALRAFAQFFPGKSWKSIRKQLSGMMKVTGRVRDCDVALELLDKAGVAKRARVALALQSRRRAAEADLREALRLAQSRNVAREWRRELEL